MLASKCKICHREYFYGRNKGRTKEKCNSCSVNLRRFALKQKCVAYKGGKCENCGYNKSNRALTFHHLDPSEKEFSIGGKHCRKWEVIRKELDKCKLLCANCHAEEHEQLDTKENPQLESIVQKVKKRNNCVICDKKLPKNGLCKICFPVKTKIVWPSADELQKMVWEMPTVKVAKKLGVSDVAIKKRCKKFNIPKPGLGYWRKIEVEQKKLNSLTLKQT
jgi:hypothetical protein